MQVQLMATYQCTVCRTNRPWGVSKPEEVCIPTLNCEGCQKPTPHIYLAQRTYNVRTIAERGADGENRIRAVSFATVGRNQQEEIQ